MMQVEDAQMSTWLEFVQSLPRGRPSNPMSRAELVQALVGSLVGRLDLVARRSFPPADTVFNALVDYFRAAGSLKLDENPKRPEGVSKPCFHAVLLLR